MGGMAPPAAPGLPRPRSGRRWATAAGRLVRVAIVAAAFLGGIGVFGASPAARAEDGAGAREPDPATVELRAALVALDSPFLRERDEAVLRLRAALPAGRAAILEAFRSG